MGYVFLAIIVAAACISFFFRSKKFRLCYKGCHGCGKCMKGYEIRPSGEEKEAPASPKGEGE